jgi:threonyl-tRNA synthetase
MSEIATTTIKIQLPDGSTKKVPQGTTALEIAKSISPRLADAALAAKLAPLDNSDRPANANPEDEFVTVDLARPIERDSRLRLLTEKDPEALEVFHHSSAHLLAAAVLELFPETKLGHGPATETGFFYDFLRATPFTTEDLAKIEAKMQEIVARNEPFARDFVNRDEALAGYRSENDFMKCHFIENFVKPDEKVSLYRTGQFVDFCRGPHIPSTGRIKAFKLLNVAGAFWLGKEGNPQLQRIYGVSFYSKKQMDEYMRQLEEAKRRDHRALGQQLDLFSTQELAGPGLIFWHPKGGLIRTIMEDWLRAEYLKRGYSLVFTPHVARRALWQTSGHEGFYAENMFDTMELDDAEYRLKPMNCPFHILIYKDQLRSYRDLPVRLGELGTVYRYERSGVMHGLMRVRGFTQDDAHIFCTPEQIEGEVEGCIDFAISVLHTFGFEEFKVELSAWDPADREHYAEVGARTQGHSLQVHPRRGRLLRAKDRRQACRCHRPVVAALHRAVRLQPAAALRAGIRRRRRAAPSTAHGAPRVVWIGGALLRRAHRALRRSLPRVAGADAGGRGAHRRAPPRLRQQGWRRA